MMSMGRYNPRVTGIVRGLLPLSFELSGSHGVRHEWVLGHFGKDLRTMCWSLSLRPPPLFRDYFSSLTKMDHTESGGDLNTEV